MGRGLFRYWWFRPELRVLWRALVSRNDDHLYDIEDAVVWAALGQVVTVIRHKPCLSRVGRFLTSFQIGLLVVWTELALGLGRFRWR